MTIRKNRFRGAAGVIVTALITAACGAASSATTIQPTTTEPPGPPTVEVSAVDYSFEGLPDRIEVGTTLTLVNESDVELHEIVVFRLDDDETRSVAELLEDQEALMAYFPRVAAVVLAPPLAAGFPVVGTGQLTESGRYAVICAIPVGADVDDYLAAAAESEGGPPEVEGGPPHFTVGMFKEVLVGD